MSGESIAYEQDARDAMTRTGFEVIDRAGVHDYQGWGMVLGRHDEEFAVLSWSYGSCEVCDSYMEMSDAERSLTFDALLERGMNEADARARFEQRKGW